jgi:hypothetical protein
MPEEQAPETMSICNLGYCRFHWSKLEPAEGVFDCRHIDDALAKWDKAGKQFAFGVMRANTHSKSPYVTPKWVFDAGSESCWIEIKSPVGPCVGSPGWKVAPVFNDPVFLAKLKAFLTALGKRYDGDPQLAFVDIRSYRQLGQRAYGLIWRPSLTSNFISMRLKLRGFVFPLSTTPTPPSTIGRQNTALRCQPFTLPFYSIVLFLKDGMMSFSVAGAWSSEFLEYPVDAPSGRPRRGYAVIRVSSSGNQRKKRRM